MINIGGEGQIIAGALMATWFSLHFRTWPGYLLLPSTMIMGFLAGGAWGFIPGILKVRFSVNEILSTVMMNAIAIQLMNFSLANDDWVPDSRGGTESRSIAPRGNQRTGIPGAFADAGRRICRTGGSF